MEEREPCAFVLKYKKLVMDLKFIWKAKESRIAHSRMKNKVIGHYSHSKPTIKLVLLVKQIEQWKRLESSEIDPHKYS